MKKIIVIIMTFLLLTSLVYAKEEVKLSKCVDGDTIKVIIDTKEYTVRMLAIDTPESVHPSKPIEYYGKEASEYTCNKVSNAKNQIGYRGNGNNQRSSKFCDKGANRSNDSLVPDSEFVFIILYCIHNGNHHN